MTLLEWVQDTPREQASVRVARNVRRLRDERRMTIRALSARLGEVGYPLLPSGVNNIENLQRRAHADDLEALARALDVEVADLFA